MIFAISLGKQPHYIMPSYPVVALLVALLFEEVLKRAGVVPRLVLRIWGVLLGAMASGLAVLSFLFLTRVLGNSITSPAMLFPIAAAAGAVLNLLAALEWFDAPGFRGNGLSHGRCVRGARSFRRPE